MFPFPISPKQNIPRKKKILLIANVFSFHLVVVWDLSSYRFACSSLRLGCSYITIFLGQTEAHQKTILTPSRWSALSAWECREHRTRRSYRISALQTFIYFRTTNRRHKETIWKACYTMLLGQKRKTSRFSQRETTTITCKVANPVPEPVPFTSLCSDLSAFKTISAHCVAHLQTDIYIHTHWSTRTHSHMKSLTYGPLRMQPERFHRSARQTDLRTRCQIGTIQYKTDLILIDILI